MMNVCICPIIHVKVPNSNVAEQASLGDIVCLVSDYKIK